MSKTGEDPIQYGVDEADGTEVSAHAGFPNPATDTSLQPLDLNKLLIRHSLSTFFMRIDGNIWQASGIFDGDIVLVDRSLGPTKSDLVIWTEEDSFRIGPLSKVPEETEVWGVITATIHQFREKKHD